jgi:riboflavin kinase/FMN adenylyltransferase
VRPAAAPPPLTTPRRRADLLIALGIDAVFVQPTDARLVGLEPEVFYAAILRGGLRAEALVEGEDFRFGARRRGDVRLLDTLCRGDGISLDVVPPVLDGGRAVSSSRLRELISAGDVAEAARLSTAAYRVTGTVVTGARRGATLGFPTANLAEIATLLPGQGVYAAVAEVPTGARHAAAVHIGPNASFGGTDVSVEAHLIDYAGDLYGSRLDVDFLARLRDTRRFATVEDLKAQLADDVAQAARIAAPHLTPAARI